MSTFDIVNDAPGLLRSEAINTTLKFDRTSPTAGRISWNIPQPAAGCAADNQAYCGILITLDTKPTAAGKAPTNGQVYSSDPTAEVNLFTGDRIDSALVVGAFYQDRTTTYFDVTGLKPNTPYYVSGYPVDCQLRYFSQGIHAYSLDFTNRGTDGTHGTQVLVLNSNITPMGVQPTDATGLTIGDSYDFTVQVGITPLPNRPIDSVECKAAAPRYTVAVNGTNAQTYEELVAAINVQFGLLTNPPQGPTPPNTGGLYWNSQQKKLFTWNGSEHVETDVIYDNAPPTAVGTGTYWLNTTTQQLSVWDGAAWIPVTVVAHSTDPTAPTADASYWFNGTNAFIWNGVTWCQTTTYNQATDPSLATDPPGGSFWFDTVHSILYKWNAALGLWVPTTAIQSETDPNALTTGAFWFNDVANQLFTLNVPNAGWNLETNVAITEIAPSTPAPGKFWYNPSTLELFQRNVSNTTWVQVDVIVFPHDPAVRSHCDLWWNLTTDQLYVWDAIGSVWVLATSFFQQSNDPSLPPQITDGSVWHNSSTGSLMVWENACFVNASFIAWPTDPTNGFPVGTAWHDTTSNKWYVFTVGGWSEIDIIPSAYDPRSLPLGTLWFNSTNNALQQWNGVAWVAVTYVTTPLTPSIGTLWFNTSTSTTMVWTTMGWDVATPKVTAELDCNGNILFTDTTVGSLSYVGLTDGTLFQSLNVANTIHTAKPGTDGASDEPLYSEIGIGTDGSDAIRNELINEIRYELGYPVVDVELTKEQMDYAITRALSELRQRSGIGYKRGFFFMMIKANEQRYYMTNKISEMNKIVDVLGVYRLTSSFLSSAHGAGVYGQIVLQHMYNMGTFDLLSYHMMADYTKLLEMLFAARVTFTWNEQRRELFLHNKFSYAEPRVCIEATVERTEQDIMSDRYARPWIRRFAAAVCRLMLAESRGKFSSLPGASGSVSLNAGELRQAAQQEMEACYSDIDSYVTDRPEEYGMGTQFLFG